MWMLQWGSVRIVSLGNGWLCVAMRGYAWLCYARQCEATRDNAGQCGATRGNALIMFVFVRFGPILSTAQVLETCWKRV